MTLPWTALQQSFATVPLKQRREALTVLRKAFLAGQPPGDYLSHPPTLAAYEEFFFPQSFVKAASVLAELGAADVKTVLDLGAAMGPFAFAAAAQWPDARLTLLDQSGAALQAAKNLAQRMGLHIETKLGSFTGMLPRQRFDLITLGNALLEVEDARADELVRSLIADQLAPNGWLVIVEPADRLHARRLQALRDRLRATDPLLPVLPCPHAEVCPAQTRDRDFCHEARALTLPDFFADAAAFVGLSDTRSRFSYLVYRQAPATPQRDGLVRIISHAIKEKGRLRYFGCSAGGLVELMRQDRLRSPANAAFDELGRGALVRVAGEAPRIKLGDGDAVEVMRPVDPTD